MRFRHPTPRDPQNRGDCVWTHDSDPNVFIFVPFNYDPVIRSIEKTGHLLVVTEASERGSFAMTLAANLTRFAFGSLKSAPRVLGSPNWIVPGAEMETSYFPQVDDIVEIVTAQFHPEKHSNRRGIRTWDDRELARKGL